MKAPTRTTETTLAVAGRPEAAAAVWRWKDHSGNERLPTPHSRLRLVGALQAGATAVFAGLLWMLGYAFAATVATSIATLVLVAAVVSPTVAYVGLRRLALKLGEWTGGVIAWLFLVPLFYMFFLPFGLLLRRGARDRLRRRLDAHATSYWEPHAGYTAASGSRKTPY